MNITSRGSVFYIVCKRRLLPWVTDVLDPMSTSSGGIVNQGDLAGAPNIKSYLSQLDEIHGHEQFDNENGFPYIEFSPGNPRPGYSHARQCTRDRRSILLLQPRKPQLSQG